jgi:hexosaminidase
MKLNLIPAPREVRIINSNQFFTLTERATVFGGGGGDLVYEIKCFFAKAFGFKPQNATEGVSDIRLLISKDFADEERYTLEVKAGGCEIKAGGSKGLFYGVQTLFQLCVQFHEKSGEIKLPFLYINDSPRFRYRGFMLDVARHFFDKQYIFKVLDMLALLKINVFHFHLTDDQGSRIILKNYPKIAEIATKRRETNGDGYAVGGYFTKADIEEIVGYAASKHIQVIPEIDIPGHCTAFISAYPELSCDNRIIEVATTWGIKDNILCTGKEEVYKFVYALLDEVAGLFPSEYVHIGGDEVPKITWNSCPKCGEVIKQNNLSGVEELQGFFTNRIIQYLAKKGKKVIVWNEAAVSGTLDKSAIMHYWYDGKKAETAKREIESGRKTIVSKNVAYYLDYPYFRLPLSKTYNFEPYELGVTNDALGAIWGVEAPLWTEWVPTEEKADYMAFPRTVALAETAWTERHNKDYDNFTERLENFYQIFDIMKIAAAPLEDTDPKSRTKNAVKKARFFIQITNRESVKNFLAMRKFNKQLEKENKKKDKKKDKN